MQEWCTICRGFRSRTKKDRDTRFKFLLMEAVLCPLSELGQMDSAMSTSTSVRSALASLGEHGAVSPPQHQGKTLHQWPGTPGTNIHPQHRGSQLWHGTVGTAPHYCCRGKSKGRLAEVTLQPQGLWAMETQIECDPNQATQRCLWERRS